MQKKGGGTGIQKNSGIRLPQLLLELVAKGSICMTKFREFTLKSNAFFSGIAETFEGLAKRTLPFWVPSSDRYIES